MKRLREEQRAQYFDEGILWPVDVLMPGEVAFYRGALEETERALRGKLKRIDNAHLHFRWAWDLALHPAILDAMEDLLGPDVVIHSSRIFYKHPHDPAFVGWHQDGLYTKLDTDFAPSAWIALSESNAENGCLRVIPRTHRSGKFAHRETFAFDNLSNHGEQIEAEIDESLAVDVTLQAGQMSVHHVNAIHGSQPNSSGTKRIGFSASYISPDVAAGDMQMVWARGRTDLRHARVVEQPPTSDIDSGIASHAEYVRSHGRGLRLDP
jgi:ectoine hydroxylase-related dioxygenase (phytanoyl-CoA dioxygenase family)